MESSTQQVESVFPSEAETASFFSSEEWDSMVDYDKNSYRNILHNYYTMQLLGLNPVKPLFMTKQTSKKAAKRKSDRSPSSHPIKNQNKEAKSSTSNSTKEAKNSTSNTHIEAKSSTSNTRKEAKSSTSNTTIEAKSSTSNTLKGLLVQEAEMFSSSKTTESIHLNNIFNAVFKVYKRYNGKIKGHYLKKKVSTEKEKKCGKRNKENYLKSRTQSNNESEGSQKNKKDQKRAPPKKPCRSIQTQTASSDHSILSSALVFVNRTGTKKVTRPLPDPRPAPKTKEEELRIRKQNRLKLKNCRRVQTQTAGENTTIEKSRAYINKERRNLTLEQATYRLAVREASQPADLYPGSGRCLALILFDFHDRELKPFELKGYLFGIIQIRGINTDSGTTASKDICLHDMTVQAKHSQPHAIGQLWGVNVAQEHYKSSDFKFVLLNRQPRSSHRVQVTNFSW